MKILLFIIWTSNPSNIRQGLIDYNETNWSAKISLKLLFSKTNVSPPFRYFSKNVWKFRNWNRLIQLSWNYYYFTYFSTYYLNIVDKIPHVHTSHCVKSVLIRSYFWSVFSCIQSEYRKIRTRNNSIFGHFSRSVFFGGGIFTWLRDIPKIFTWYLPWCTLFCELHTKIYKVGFHMFSWVSQW